MSFTAIYRTFYPNSAEYIFFSAVLKILGYAVSLKEYGKMKNSFILYDNNEIKPEIHSK